MSGGNRGGTAGAYCRSLGADAGENPHAERALLHPDDGARPARSGRAVEISDV